MHDPHRHGSAQEVVWHFRSRDAVAFLVLKVYADVLVARII
jgi:hypothetical protein